VFGVWFLVFGAKKYHENMHEVSVKDTYGKHEMFNGLFVISPFRVFVIKYFSTLFNESGFTRHSHQVD